ncbi:RibD family protein [Dubosiella newyorkensis]|uniref:RibD family protein n=1 Tax=Dubosiella newyorkensis TaxID=1862672 RepID=UPI00259C8CE1|nr:RibD family protein [Dubosiella newyorkensis]
MATACDDDTKIDIYKKHNCKFLFIKRKGNHIDLAELMKRLGEMKIDSVFLEGGSILNWSALEQQIVDEVQIYIAPKIFGGNAPSPVSGQGVSVPVDAVNLKPYAFSQIGPDFLIESEVVYSCSQEL